MAATEVLRTSALRGVRVRLPHPLPIWPGGVMAATVALEATACNGRGGSSPSPATTKDYMNIAIVGSRGYLNYEAVYNYVLNNFRDGDVLVSGGCPRGADYLAERAAGALGIKTLIFPADWNRLGKSAGFIRNADIVKNADKLVAFWDGESRGTQHVIGLANKAGIPVEIYINTGLPYEKETVHCDVYAPRTKKHS